MCLSELSYSCLELPKFTSSVVSYTWTPEDVRFICLWFVGTVLFSFSGVKIAKGKQVVHRMNTDFPNGTLIFTSGPCVILYVFQCHGVTGKEKKEMKGRKETHFFKVKYVCACVCAHMCVYLYGG